MVRSPSDYLWPLAFGLSLATFAVAVERTTDAERSYRAIRYSSDAATQLLAERWNGLVRLQEWTDATGQFKTRAKYVEHDPELAWVKLRVIQGSAEERIVKDIQVPIEKLSPICRSRVRQIAFLTEKVAAAVAEEQSAETADGEPGAAGSESNLSDPTGRFGAESVDGRADSLIRGPAEREGRLGRGERGPAERPEPAGGRPVARPPRGRPLPAMLPPLPSNGIPTAMLAPAAEQPSAADAVGSTQFKHPATAAELRDVFAQAFSAGDKATLEKLVYWADTSPEQRRVTYSSLLDYAGARLTRCDIVEQEGGEAVTDYTVNYATVLDIGFETRTVDIDMNWPIGEIGGKYYLGAWANAEKQPIGR